MPQLIVATLAFALLGLRPPGLPTSSVLYEPSKVTQYVDRNTPVDKLGRPLGPTLRRTLQVPIKNLPDRDWHQSGGMRGVRGFLSLKYRSDTVWHGYAKIPTLNASGHIQRENGIAREFVDGSRFDDVLWFNGRVFEWRTLTKEKGEWLGEVTFKDEKARPPGYTGLKQTCASCHTKAGTGGYAAGLVPGGDGIFSAPLDWSVVPKQFPRE